MSLDWNRIPIHREQTTISFIRREANDLLLSSLGILDTLVCNVRCVNIQYKNINSCVCYYLTWQCSWCHVQLQWHKSPSAHTLLSERRSDEDFLLTAPADQGPASPSHLGSQKRVNLYFHQKHVCISVCLCWFSLRVHHVIWQQSCLAKPLLILGYTIFFPKCVKRDLSEYEYHINYQTFISTFSQVLYNITFQRDIWY